MSFQNLFSRWKILSDAFNSHMVCYIVINSFFVSFATSGGSYNPSQNTLRLISKFEKCVPSSMESLTANFIHFSSAIAKDYVRTQFRDFTKIFSFSKPFDNS